MVDLATIKICFVAGTLGQGGAERQLFYMLQALRESGAVVRLLCLTQGEFWESKIQALGVPVTWVGQDSSRLARVRRIARELRAHAPDIVQSAHFYTNLYVALAARWLGLKEIGAVRNDALSEVRANGRVLGRLSLRLPRVLAPNSQAGLRNAVKLGVPAARCHFLPNVVDTGRFGPADRSQRESVTLLAVGRLVPQKRMDRFLRLLATVRAASPIPVRGLIAGTGELRESLMAQARELGLLPDGIEFLGGVSDLVPVYQRADLFVLTSDWEGTPNVVLEASACGLPVVATRAGGTADVVRVGETGLLFDADDEEGMSRALIELVGEVKRRFVMGAAARRFVETNHSVGKLPEFLAALYHKATA